VNNRFAVIETSTPFSRLGRTAEILTTVFLLTGLFVLSVYPLGTGEFEA
jgi:hypothetical protein